MASRREPRSVPCRMEKPSIHQPGHTCPDIDDMLAQLERLRKANSELREYGDEWSRIADEMFDLATAWEKHAGELQEELDSLKSEMTA